MNEEKKLVEDKNANLIKLKDKFERQIKMSLDTITDSQDSLKGTRKELQELKIINNELEHRNRLLQERVDELYASVGNIA